MNIRELSKYAREIRELVKANIISEKLATDIMIERAVLSNQKPIFLW